MRSLRLLCPSALVFLAASLLHGADAPAFDPAAWEFVSPDHAPLAAVCAPATDGTLAIAGKPLGYIQTKASHTNYRFHAEWRWAGTPGNAGILVHIATGPVDRNLWPRCFQIQTKHTRAGDLLPMAGATFAEPLSTPPDAKTPVLNLRAATSERPPGEWNACDIVCRDGTIEVTINGVLQNLVTHCDPAAGRVGFQLEGVAYQLRGISLQPLPVTAP